MPTNLGEAVTDTPYDPATDPDVTAQDPEAAPGTEPPKPRHSVDTEGDDDGEDGDEGADPPW